MKNSQSESYKSAGVDVTEGYRAVALMKKHIQSTYTDGVIGDIGGFGGLFAPNFAGMEKPVLVSGADGVGTKLKLAFVMNKHDTIGIDCVAMCVNDIICCGAMPLFFLDYIAVGKNIPEQVEQIVSGVAEGCRQAGCALIGGETAEMPGFYPVGEYDVAGFAVGMADYPKMIDGSKILAGDVIIGIPSSGLHSNGFSLARKIFLQTEDALSRYVGDLGGTLGDTLLAPTKIYVKTIKNLLAAVAVKGICNITGGGFYENIPRMLPDGISAKIDKNSYGVPPIFKLTADVGKVPERDMYNTFNMGVGMCVAVSPTDVDTALLALKNSGERAFVLGEAVASDEGVILC